MPTEVDLQRLVSNFASEAKVLCERAAREILALERPEHAAAARRARDDLARHVHTLKGSAATLGLGDVKEIAHRLEALVEAGEGPLHPAIPAIANATPANARAVVHHASVAAATAMPATAMATKSIARNTGSSCVNGMPPRAPPSGSRSTREDAIRGGGRPVRGVQVDRLVAGRDVVGVEALGGSATVQRIEVPGRLDHRRHLVLVLDQEP